MDGQIRAHLWGPEDEVEVTQTKTNVHTRFISYLHTFLANCEVQYCPGKMTGAEPWSLSFFKQISAESRVLLQIQRMESCPTHLLGLKTGSPEPSSLECIPFSSHWAQQGRGP